MSDAGYYRAEARRCRGMARNTRSTIEAARRWTELADEYEELAARLERGGRFTISHVPTQRQAAETWRSRPHETGRDKS